MSNTPESSFSFRDPAVNERGMTISVSGLDLNANDSVFVEGLDGNAAVDETGALRFSIPLHLFASGRDLAVSFLRNGHKLGETSLTLAFLGETARDARAQLVGTLVPGLMHSAAYTERFFAMWQEHGFHITPVHFYQPLPDTRNFTPETFSRRSTMPGIDFREAEQLRLASEVFPRFRSEYEALPLTPTGNPNEFYLKNKMFEAVDAQLLYCMIREFRPKKILEVGSGWSSLLAAKAAALNGPTHLTCIEPYPTELLRGGVEGITQLIEEPVQRVPLSRFEELGENDILFIDSSHVVKIESDVNYLYLEVLPRLAPGVIVHIHDIFLPLEYPPWHAARGLFWSEQYLLQAFLINNRDFEVLFSSAFMHTMHEDTLRAAFGRAYGFGGSFWMRRVTA